MRSIIPCIAGAILTTLLTASPLHANDIKFEGIVPDGGLHNIRPGKPLVYDGYMFTSAEGEAAVFGNTTGYDMIGDPTAVLGFAGGETVTLMGDKYGAFDLVKLLLGPSNVGSGTTDITLTGYTSVSTIVHMETFLNLTTATLEALDWTDLTYLTITATTDSSFDDVIVRHPRVATAFEDVPEPASSALLAAGMLGLIICKKGRSSFLKKRSKKLLPACID